MIYRLMSISNFAFLILVDDAAICAVRCVVPQGFAGVFAFEDFNCVNLVLFDH